MIGASSPPPALLADTSDLSPPFPSSSVVIETALDWWKRSKRENSDVKTYATFTEGQLLSSPTAAAAAFCRGKSGLTWIDAAWRNDCNKLPSVISIDGDVGKTWTVISLAARFVVATRKRKNKQQDEKPEGQNENNNQNVVASESDETDDQIQKDSFLPKVIILDSTYNVTASKVAAVVRSTLLKQKIEDTDIEQDMECCLSRIHVITIHGDTGMAEWVPILEALNAKLRSIGNVAAHDDDDDDNDDGSDSIVDAPPTTLLLWDGFLSEPINSTIGDDEMAEVVRQLTRLLSNDETGSIALVLTIGNGTSSGRNYLQNKVFHDWEQRHQRVTHRIRLERGEGKHCIAVVNNRTRFPFSLSLSGILC